MEFEAIGTHWKIDLHDKISDSDESDIFARVKMRIDVYDKHYSRFCEDSLVTEMSKHGGVYVLPEDAKPLFDLYKQLYQISAGAVTPLIGNLLSDAGYDATYSLISSALRTPLAWEEVMEYAYPNLVMKQPALIDVGAAGKGYLVDLVAEVLESCGIARFTINAGGDILHRDTERVRVGLEHPEDPTSVIGVVEIGNESICASAGNRRTWGDFHHIMDPRTQQSPTHIAGTWVRATNALMADMLATALFFVDPEILRAHFSFSYLIVYADYHLVQSEDFGATLFS